MTRYRTTLAAAALLPLAVLTACGGEDGGGDGGTELTLAHSYTEDQPQHLCGAEVIKEEVEAAGVDLTVEIFPNSQLGCRRRPDRLGAVG